LGYNFVIEYKVGKENQGVDALSKVFLVVTKLSHVPGYLSFNNNCNKSNLLMNSLKLSYNLVD